MSTATAVREEPSRAAASWSPGSALTGTGTLVRLILRRDRIKLSVWLLGITVFALSLARLPAELAETAEGRQDMSRFMEGGLGAVFGPGYGREDVAAGLYFAGVYGLFFYLLAALMSMQLVSRHTRVDEQHGRAELLRSTVVGRHAQLTAALSVALAVNLVLGLLLTGVMTASFDGPDAWLFGAGVGAVGLVFAAVAALTVQVTEHSRAAVGMAGAVLGGAWLVRTAGDMISDYGSPLSWLSPLAWSNQTRPYVDGRWWPLLLSLSLAAVASAAGYALAGRRDLGAGLLAARRGSAEAAPWLRSPLSAAFRLQWSSLLWWTAALAAFGFVFGALADQVADPEGMSAERIERFGGSLDTVVEGFLGISTLLIATLATTMVVLGLQAVRTDETGGRAEPVLAGATSRSSWLGAHVAVLAIGVTGLLLVVGLAGGVGAAIAVGDASYILDQTGAHLAHAPGVLVLLGLAVLLYGVLPRAIGAVWILLGLGVFSGLFGTLVDLPAWIRNLAPMAHVGQPPLDDISWLATVILLGVASGMSAVGLAGFRRRDLESK